jgi:hypothetical protein
MPKIALFDMDGTLFDYEGQMERDLIRLASPEEAEITAQIMKGDQWALAKEYPWLEARMDLIKSVPGWWKNLPTYQLGWDVYKWAVDIGFCTKILTKGPRSKSFAWAEKVDCISMHFGDDMPIDIVGKNKSDVYGRVLVDDYPPYMLGWLENRPRGLGILPAGRVNEGFEHPNAIRYDGNNWREVQDALQAAYDRESKQLWQELAAWKRT